MKNFFIDQIFDNNFVNMADFFFNSSVKDMQPYSIYKKGNQYIFEVKTLGINPDDIEISLEDNILCICGETKNEYSDTNFNIKLKLKIDKRVLSNLSEEGITYSTKNGITYIFLNMNETKTDGIKIKRL